MSLNTCACGYGCSCVGKPKTDEEQPEKHDSTSRKAAQKEPTKGKSKGKSKEQPKHQLPESAHTSDDEKEGYRYGHLVGRQLTPYECQLEDEVQQLQEALFTLTSHYAKVQFRLRQIAAASDSERIALLKELERMTSEPLDGSARDQQEKLPTLQSDASTMGSVRMKQHKIIAQLRGRLQNLAAAVDDYFVTDRKGQSRGETTGDSADGYEEDYDWDAEELQGNASKGTFLSEAWSDTIYGDTDNDGQSTRSKSKSKHRKGKGKSKGGKNALGTQKAQSGHGDAGDRHSRGECSKDCPSYKARRKSGSAGRSSPRNTSSKKDVSPNPGRLYSVLRETQSLPHNKRHTGDGVAVKKVRSTAKNHLEAIPKGSPRAANRKQKASATPSEKLAKGWPLSWQYLRLDEGPCTKSSTNIESSSNLCAAASSKPDAWSDVRQSKQSLKKS
ncbi:uncharacterized protein LOC117893899 isoform X1 [Drosophila subobscura]|uniref:uncharacterized protein LOC117893899 isoform X1 n=1 Tax=Drosophila subobscura TaxID=7241 RepID=UPI00155AEA7D|nr:uncharacterized protein LOC117893899 isoform X1 [Drosophila subobscura]